jgi:hypothetical protein
VNRQKPGKKMVDRYSQASDDLFALDFFALPFIFSFRSVLSMLLTVEIFEGREDSQSGRRGRNHERSERREKRSVENGFVGSIQSAQSPS